MRILHLTGPYAPALGGIETHVAALAQRQAARGDEVTVCTRTAGGPDAAPSSVTVLRAPTRMSGCPAGLDDYDLVHAHVSVVSPFAARFAAVAARRGVPTVVTVHSLWNGWGPAAIATGELTSLRRAPVLWTAVSEVAASQVAARLPRGTTVHVLPNAVSVQPRPSSPDRSGPVRLVSTMRLARRKRPLQLLAIAAELNRRTGADFELAILGDGPLLAAVEHRVRQLGLVDIVRLSGRVSPEEVVRELAAADVYVAPAVLESFGLAALEARSVGVPVVGRAGTGLAEFVETGRTGMLCQSDEEMARVLQVLVEDPAVRWRMAEAARTARPDSSWEHSLDRHDLVYGVATGRARSRALAGLRTVAG